MFQPGEARRDVLGETRHRSESLAITVSVAPGIDQQYGEARLVQQRHHWPHHRGVGTPAMHHQHCRHGALRCAWWRYQPAGETFAALSGDANFAHPVCRHARMHPRQIVRDTWRAQAPQDRPMREDAQRPETGERRTRLDDQGNSPTPITFGRPSAVRPSWPTRPSRTRRRPRWHWRHTSTMDGRPCTWSPPVSRRVPGAWHQA